MLLKSDTMCWVTSKLTTGEMVPTVLDVIDFLRFFTIIDSHHLNLNLRHEYLERAYFFKQLPYSVM